MKKEVKIEDYTEGLNEGQTERFNELVEFMESRNQLFSIKGYAGTGKTFLMTKFFMYYKKKYPRKNICLTAPTNKAVGVLKNTSSKDLKRLVDFATIHQLLGLKPMINDEGVEVFIRDSDFNKKDLLAYDVILIDETSMLNDDLFHLILQRINPKEPSNSRFGEPKLIKVLFTGDPRQIPPVGKEDCEPYLRPELYDIQTVELSQIMRQKEGNPIVAASFDIRDNIRSKYIDFSKYHDLQHFHVCNVNDRTERDFMLEKVKSMFCSPELKESMDYVKVISWRNVQVDIWNNLCRRHYHGVSDLSQIMVNDYLIANKPVFEEDEIVLTAATELKVLEVESTKISTCEHIEEELSCFDVKVTYFDFDAQKDIELNIYILNKEESGPRHQKILEALKNAAKHAPENKRKWFWQQYFKSMKVFADVSYGFAITAHKSQGSTYKNVFIDVADIVRNPNIEERNRILYTSITRASDSCFLITRK